MQLLGLCKIIWVALKWVKYGFKLAYTPSPVQKLN